MIFLNYIKIKDFLSFKGEHLFKFPRQGIFSIKGQISGKEENSNGSGKSNFLEAIAYTMDFANLPAIEMQNWFTEDPFSVELSLDINSQEFKIKRGKNTYEVFYQDQHLKSQEAKDKIKKVLLDSWLLNFITYRAQNISGNFLSLANADRLDFLINVLELNKFDQIIQNANEAIKSLELSIENYQADHQRNDLILANNIRFVQMLDESIVKKDKELTEIQNTHLQEPVKDSFFDNSKIDSFNTSIELLKQNVQDNSGLILLIDNKLKEFNVLGNAIDHKMRDLDKLLSGNNSSNCKRSIIDLDRKNASLAKGICSECGQIYHDHKKSMDKYDAELIVYKDLLPQLEAKEQQLRELKLESDTVKSKLDTFNKEKNKLLIASSDKDVLLKSKELSMYLSDCQSKYDRAYLNYQLQLKHNTEKQKTLVTELSDIRKKSETIKVDDNNLKEKNDSLQSKIVSFKEKLLLEQEINSVLGKQNFILLILEQILGQISSEATSILQAIPNAVEYSLLLDTESENKKGTIKKLINLKVFKNGIERSYKSLSGGQQCSVNLAIDAAIAKMLSERTSKNFGWIIFDESLNGLDSNSKMEAIETLKTLFPTKLTMIVEHALEVKESLDGEILIKNNKGASEFQT